MSVAGQKSLSELGSGGRRVRGGAVAPNWETITDCALTCKLEQPSDFGYVYMDMFNINIRMWVVFSKHMYTCSQPQQKA